MPHRWCHSLTDCPCMAVWHALLLTSCLYWCQMAVSAGWPYRGFLRLDASSSQHALGLVFTAKHSLTLTRHWACTHPTPHAHITTLRLRAPYFTSEANAFPDHHPMLVYSMYNSLTITQSCCRKHKNKSISTLAEGGLYTRTCSVKKKNQRCVSRFIVIN